MVCYSAGDFEITAVPLSPLSYRDHTSNMGTHSNISYTSRHSRPNSKAQSGLVLQRTRIHRAGLLAYTSRPTFLQEKDRVRIQAH